MTDALSEAVEAVKQQSPRAIVEALCRVADPVHPEMPLTSWMNVARAFELTIALAWSSGGWTSVRLFREAFVRSGTQPLTAKWGDFHDERPDLWGPPDFQKESTYDKCVEWEFDPVSSILKVLFHDGDMCYGEPVSRGSTRVWEFKIDVTDANHRVVIKEEFVPKFKRGLERLATDLIDAQRDQERNNAITKKMLHFAEMSSTCNT